MHLTFGIIGTGRIAHKHAIEIKHIGGTLIGCFDINFNKSWEFAEKHGAKKYDCLDNLLQDDSINIIVVCSPNGLHAEHTLSALNTGKHVVCEKPMALNLDDCKKMIDAAEKNNRQLFMVMQNRFNPPVVELKKIIEQNLLGNISNVHLSCYWNRNNEYYTNSEWKGTKELDGGVLYTQFSHFIDILIWMFGEVEDLNAMVGNFNHKEVITIEDSGIINLRFKNKILCTINYSINAFKKNYEGSLTVIGEKGIVKVGGQYLNKMECCEIENYIPKLIPEGKSENDYGEYQGSMSNHDKVYQNVVNVFASQEKIATTGTEGMSTVSLIEEIYRKAIWN